MLIELDGIDERSTNINCNGIPHCHQPHRAPFTTASSRNRSKPNIDFDTGLTRLVRATQRHVRACGVGAYCGRRALVGEVMNEGGHRPGTVRALESHAPIDEVLRWRPQVVRQVPVNVTPVLIVDTRDELQATANRLRRLGRNVSGKAVDLGVRLPIVCGTSAKLLIIGIEGYNPPRIKTAASRWHGPAARIPRRSPSSWGY